MKIKWIDRVMARKKQQVILDEFANQNFPQGIAQPQQAQHAPLNLRQMEDMMRAQYQNIQIDPVGWQIRPDEMRIIGADEVISLDPMQKARRAMDAVEHEKHLNQTQRWIMEKYAGKWDELMEQPIQFVDGNVVGSFGSILQVKEDKQYPVFTKFKIHDTEDQLEWWNIWHFELTRTPEEIWSKDKEQRKERQNRAKSGVEELKQHHLVSKCYISGSHLIIVTKPTLAIHRDTGKEISDMPMGRWVFDINMEGNLNDVNAWNLDFAQIRDNAAFFHFFRCWGGHPGQTLNLFNDKNWFAVTDFLIQFFTLYPHDGSHTNEIISWGENRRNITDKDKAVVTHILKQFRKPSQWVIGEPTQEIEKIADLFRKDIPVFDKFEGARDPNAKFVPCHIKRDLPTGTFIKMSPQWVDHPMVLGLIGKILYPRFYSPTMIAEFENGRQLVVPLKYILKFDGPVKKKPIEFGPNTQRYDYAGDAQDGRGDMIRGAGEGHYENRALAGQYVEIRNR